MLPAGTWRLRSATAVCAPKVLVTPSIWTADAVMVLPPLGSYRPAARRGGDTKVVRSRRGGLARPGERSLRNCKGEGAPAALGEGAAGALLFGAVRPRLPQRGPGAAVDGRNRSRRARRSSSSFAAAAAGPGGWAYITRRRSFA